MKKNKNNKFDWYGLSQRFSIRRCHFGAASVLLGTAMILSLTASVSADDVDTAVSTPITKEADKARKRALAFPNQGQDIPTGTGLRKVTENVYQDAIATIKALSNLNDIEKAYYTGEVAKQTRGIINRDKKVSEIVEKAKAHNDLVANNRGTTEADAIENTVDPNSNNSFSGTVKLKFGGAINDKTDTYTRPLAGVKVYAQWYEKNGYASPIYTTTTRADGSFDIGAADFIGADGKVYHFDADAALPSGEKWRIWSINPDTGKYSLLYSFGDQQISPEGIVKDITAGADQDIARDRLFNAQILYAYKTSDIWRQDAKDTASVITEGGYVKGSVYWNNNSPAGNQITADLASREKQYDPGMPGVTVYASYLSDYAVAQLNSAEVLAKFVDPSSKWKPTVNKDRSSNIRKDQWTQANEDKLRAYILEQVTANRSQWVAETVKTTTDGNGDFALQFNGTFGHKWNDPGFDGLINSRDTVLRSEEDVVNTETGETKKGKDWNGVVAPSAAYGSWTTQGADSKTDLSKASKHVNTDWVFVTTEEKEGISFYTPFYGDVPKGGTGLAPGGKWQLQGTGTRWDVVIRDGDTAGLNNDSVTNVYFAAINDVLTFDIYNYDSYGNFAKPGDTAKVKTTGLTPNLGETYKIVWKDEGGNVVHESGPLTVNPDGSLPESEWTVPADLKKTTVYFAELYALGKNDANPTYPVQKDSFTAVYRELPQYEDTYSNLGEKKDSQAPTFDVEHTAEVEKNSVPKGATFSLLSKDGGDTISGFKINEKTGVITWENPTEDASVDVLVTYEDGSVAKTTAKFFVNKPETDKYTPTYAESKGKAGQSVTSEVPTFKDKQDAVATPEVKSYALGANAPAGATIDAATGAVTYPLPADAASGASYDIPVLVTYADGSTDNATAKFTVIESDKDLYTPAYADTKAKAGSTATSKAPSFTDKDGKTVTPTGVKYELGDDEPPYGATVDSSTGIVSLPIEDSAGAGTEFTVPVKVVYPDGSIDTVKAKITVVDSEKDKDTYTPETKDQTVGLNETPKAEDSITNLNDLPDGTKVTFKDPVDTGSVGDKDATIVVTYPDQSTEEVPVKIKVEDKGAPTIDSIDDQTVVEGKGIAPIKVKATDDSGKTPKVTVDGLPDGVTYDSTTGVISGTPTVTNWGNDEEKTYTVTVKATDDSGNETTETFVIKVQRDTDKDGDPDVTDKDDDGDGFTDDTEKDAGTDPKNPDSKPTTTIGDIKDKKVTEGQAIDPISVTTTNVPEGGTTEVSGLPDGVTYNPTTGEISGTPTKITDWGKDEESRNFPVKVVVKDKDGKVIAEKPFVITVQRDTDKDGDPDVTDTDDDGDGFTDDVEKGAGTDPKDPDSKPAPDKDTTKPTIDSIDDQTVVEGKGIAPIKVKATDDSGKTPKVTVDGLPDGVTYDPTTGVISGTPTVTNWGNDEEKTYTVTVKATDDSGNETTKTFVIKVQRDTDKDGDPDVTDTDDDGDGFTDDVEKGAGTDPKDPSSKPAPNKDTTKPTIDSIDDQTVVEGKAITPITVKTADDSGKAPTVTVAGLPDGVTYNPTTGVISGTPTVTNWGNDEEKTYTVTVKATDDSGNETTETFVIKVQRDTDKDGDPDVTDTDDDGDGFTDDVEKGAGTDPKNPSSKPAPNKDTTKPTIDSIDDQTVVEGKAITPITVKTADDSGKTPKVTVDGLPDGVTYNPTTGVISGTPTVTNWGNDEEKTYTVTVKATDDSGNETTETFVIKVQRDTDKDGLPDVTDSDDDNDSFTDDEETQAGTNPKNPDSKPEGLSVTTSPAKVMDGQPVPDGTVVVTPSKDGSTITSTPTNGLSVDEKGNLTGTPTVTDWGKDEEERIVTIPVKVTNGKETKEVMVPVTIQRDTDKDGTPDVTDPDDDNDGFTDDVEKDAGSDPKDPNSKPAPDKDTTNPTIDPIEDQTVVEGKGITPIMVKATDDSGKAPTITVTGLPDGVTYDPATGMISGTPTVTDWGTDEEKTFTVTVKATDDAGNETTETFVIKVQRDTDKDGDPDVTDPDDDGDGFTDDDEKKAGTNPKDADSKPMPDTDITADKPNVSANGDGSVTIKVGEDNTTTTIDFTDEDGNSHKVRIVKDPTTGNWAPKDQLPDGVTVGKDGTVTIPADKVKDGTAVTATGEDVKGNIATDSAIAKPNSSSTPNPGQGGSGQTGSTTIVKPTKGALPKTGSETSTIGVYGLVALVLGGFLALGKRKREDKE